MAGCNEQLRRSSRVKTPAKYTTQDKEGVFTLCVGTEIQQRRQTRQIGITNSDAEETPDELTRELETELQHIEEDTQRPTELYTEAHDVSGATMYKFPAPSKSGAMALKAALSSQPPSTPKTPRSHARLKHDTIAMQTPISVRSRLKKKLAAIALSSSENDSSSEEYVPTDEVETSEDDTTESDKSDVKASDNDDDDDDHTSKHSVQSKVIPILSTPSTKSKRRADVKYNDYHLKTDEYFETQSAKVLTSDRTLGRLQNPQLDEERLQLLLANQSHVSEEHKEALKSISRDHKTLFSMWQFVMEEGYSLLLHGLGSKRILINDFHKEVLFDYPTLVVNGFFPSLTIKEILDGILVDLLGLESPSNPNEALNIIEKVLKENPDDRLYLLVHNIDGIMLRSSKAQDTLSLLASIPNLSLVASIDHINTPLLWDNIKHSRYNFCWWDVTTLLPYEAETSFESSIMVQRSGALVLSSLVNVFLSLTTNARAIYLLLVKHQLNHANNNTYPGMAFKDLYWGAREAFLVSSDLALRAQLTEFIDHKLVRSKRNLDGAEYLNIPLDNALLQQFLEQQESA